MKIKSLLSALFLLVAIVGMANETVGKITGVIKDGSGNGLPYVSIEIYTKGEVQDLVSGGMSDEKGGFNIEDVPYGEYELVLMAVGFADEVKEITIQSSNQDLGVIILGGMETVQLEGAEIRAETSTYRTEIDKRVIDVGKDLISAGADAAAVLNNIQSVSVDPQTGELSLRGNENVKVMVDGKPSSIPANQLLKQLSSNSISKIEIITNPSAKYEAEGNSGIINIITHKSKRKGYNVGLDLGYTQGNHARFNGSLNSNLNVGKFNFFANYTANEGKNFHFGDRMNFDSKLHQTFGVMNEQWLQGLKLGFDWFISDNTALTLYTKLGFLDAQGYIRSGVVDEINNVRYNNFDDLDGYSRSTDWSLNLKQNLGRDDHHITLDVLYAKNNDHDFRTFDNEYPIDTYWEKRVDEVNNTRVNLDYSNTLKWGKLEAGAQFRNEKVEDFYNSDREIAQNGETFKPLVNYDFQRSIYSAYVNYENTFGRFGVQAGLRAEQVEENSKFWIEPTGEGKYKNDYLAFYPSVFLTYEVNDRGQLSLNYSRRVDRPNYGQVSPMPQWTLATLINKGNPDLKSQFTHSFELGYLQKFKGGHINAVAFYRQINDRIFRYMEAHPTDPNITIMKWINYDKSNSYGVELSVNYKPFKWWYSNLSFDFFANELALDGEETTAKPFSIRANNQFTITKNFSLQNFFMYRGKYKFVQGEMQPRWSLDLGARYSFMDGKASFTARVSDIFKTLNAEAAMNHPYRASTVTNWESRTFYLGFSYSFGGEVRKRDIDNQENQSTPGAGLGI
jgi:iron complex outermembrane receptor protein